jgi:hypothetical protein
MTTNKLEADQEKHVYQLSKQGGEKQAAENGGILST